MALPLLPIAAGVGFVWGLWKLFTWGGGSGGGGGGEVESPPVVTYDELGTTYEDGYNAGKADGLAANITFAWESSPDWESGKVHYHADKPEAWKKGYNAGYYAAIKPSSGGGGGGGGGKDVTGTVKPPPGNTYEDGFKAGQADGAVAYASSAFDPSPDYEHMMVHFDSTKSADWQNGYLVAYNAAVKGG